MIVRFWIVNYEKEVGNVSCFRHWTVENCIVGAASAPSESLLIIDTSLFF